MPQSSQKRAIDRGQGSLEAAHEESKKCVQGRFQCHAALRLTIMSDTIRFPQLVASISKPVTGTRALARNRKVANHYWRLHSRDNKGLKPCYKVIGARTNWEGSVACLGCCTLALCMGHVA
ncbi:uncharacterized protein EI90DRAFT_3011030 [Cantharellus anzutake]|uniref:uncharacterized protein n=1 Tax=Cantharellus anzutake TaxID=1750568 RepID=UPI001904AB04|nr:uncharacterized protein EI90DRAFT_3011030 [Cantharellus anzutake]KAF8344272.1 hypothetical protein EI90DRAFT_3011030 [Cantharellus anzutake]